MSTAFTLICNRALYTEAFEVITRTVSGDITLEGRDDSWKRIMITSPHSRITFTSMARQRPGDEFSKLILSLRTFAREIRTPLVDSQKRLLERILGAKLLIGVVTEPDLSDEDGHLECLGELCSHLDAIIFNGDGFLNADGDLILDYTGTSEENDNQ